MTPGKARPAPVPPLRVPGSGVHLSEDERHAFQHHCVERDLWAYESQPKTAAAGPSRREAAKKATWTLVTHMVGMHHARPAPDVPYEQIRAEHDRLHSSGPAASTGA